MRVVLAGGGTAGHIEPALALADALRLADKGVLVTCLGTERGLETRLVSARGYELELIPPVPLPRSVTPKLLTVPGRLAGAIHKAGQVLDKVGADVLVGFGGYVSAPAYIAARRHNVPIVVHEANPSAGFANRLGAMLTTHVYTSQPDTQKLKGECIGLPIRREIAELDRLALGDKARAHFGLRTDMPVLLVTGGSQGARSLNHALGGAVAAIGAAGVQVLHVTGPKNTSAVAASAGPAPYVAVPYVDRMDLAYAAADFALCRAGAMTCAELTAVGLPAAYVPLPHGNGEQRLNALPIVQRGGGMLVDDAELTAEWITTTLLPVLTNIDRVVSMSEAAAALGRKNADKALAAAVIQVAASGPPRALPAATPPPTELTTGPPPASADPWDPAGGSLPHRYPPRDPPAPYQQAAPVPEGGFFQPTGERAASQRASGLRPTPGQRPGGRRPGAQFPGGPPLGGQQPGGRPSAGYAPGGPSPLRQPPGQSPMAQPPVGQRPGGDAAGKPLPMRRPPGQSPAGQSPSGQSPSGPVPPGQPPLGRPSPLGQSPLGQSPSGQSSLGRPPFGQSSSPGQSPLGQSSSGEAPLGQPPAGPSPLGQSSLGQSPLGPSSSGQGSQPGGPRAHPPGPGRHRQPR